MLVKCPDCLKVTSSNSGTASNGCMRCECGKDLSRFIDPDEVNIGFVKTVARNGFSGAVVGVVFSAFVGFFIIRFDDITHNFIACAVCAPIGAILGMVWGEKFFDFVEEAFGSFLRLFDSPS